VDVKAGAYHTLPAVDFTYIQGGGLYPTIDKGTNAELKLGMTSIRGKHSLKFGWQERRYWYTSTARNYPSGEFQFTNTYVRAADNTSTASNQGLEWAAFMLGVPNRVMIDTNDTGYWSTPFRALYVQDHWRLTSRINLSMGLRYEHEAGISERFDRGVSGGFLYGQKLPITAEVEAAYALNPVPGLPTSQFHVLGGTEYLGASRKTYTKGVHHFLPRIGATYQLNPRTVLRGGYGWYYDTLNSNNTRPDQYGYSTQTRTTLSTDNGLTFCCGVGAAGNLSASKNILTDPFPVRADGTRFDSTFGNRLGSMANAGRGLTFTPIDFNPAWQQRWRLDVQRELQRDVVLEVAYSGSYAKIPVTQPVSYLPQQYWATGNVRNSAIDTDLTGNVTNPFNIKNLPALQASDSVLYNYLSTQSFFTGSTVQKQVLLRAFPHMNGLNGLRPGVSFADARGANKYHDFQVRLEKRFSRGFQSALMYTRAYGKVQDVYYNQFDASPSYQTNNGVRPHRLVWTAIYELPFGKARRWANSGPLEHIVGGWQLSWIYQYQTGPATSWSNVFFYGDLDKIGDLFKQQEAHAADIHTWFDPNIAYKTGTGQIPQGFQGFEGRSAMQPGVYHVRVFPTLLDSLRADGIRKWDVKLLRKFKPMERLSINLSVDLLDVTNHTNFGAPVVNPTNANFGKVTSQNGASRIIQANLQIEF